MSRTIKATINQKKEFLDKNSNQYLILELDSGESIFVFSGKVKEERWNELEEGKEVNFTIEEGKNGANLLVDYVIKN